MSRIIFLMLFCWICHAWADDIYLRNGRIIQGKIVKRHGTRMEIKVGPGSMFVEEKDIDKVISKASPSEIFREKYAAVDRHNAQALLDMAQWCKKNLPYKYKTILVEAQKAKLNQAIHEAGSNPDRLYQVVIWAKQNHLYRGFQDIEEILCRRIVGIAPDHAGARSVLGQEKYNGEWLLRQEAKHRESRDFAAKMREKGFILFNEQWMKPEEAKWNALVADLQSQIKQAKDQHAQAEERTRKARDEAEQARRARPKKWPNATGNRQSKSNASRNNIIAYNENSTTT